MKNTRVFQTIGSVAAATVFCCGTAMAQHGGGNMSQGSPSQSQGQNQSMNDMQANSNNGASPSDRMFVKKALQGSMAEIQVAQLALQKSSDDQVKQFAQRMVTDHGKMIEDMKPVAAQVGVKVPDGPDKKQKQMMAQLQALNGADFDKAYVQAMVKDHKDDDSDFKTEISSGQSPLVKDAASKADPIIESHLMTIQEIAKKMNLSAGM